MQAFTSRFNELKGKQDQLTNLQKLQQKAADRLATLQAEQQSRLPKVEVLEAASVPQTPSSPQYARDAAIAVAAAIVAGLLTMAIVELFNRDPRVRRRSSCRRPRGPARWAWRRSPWRCRRSRCSMPSA